MARHREFDTDQVLAQVMDRFWAHGYEATSVEDLTAATGLSRSSLYQAFGSKRGLYGEALDRYMGELEVMMQPLEGDPGIDGIVRFFENWERRILDGEVDPSRGCLMVNSTTELAGRDDAVFRRSADYRALLVDRFAAALGRSRERGEVSDGDQLARARALVAGVMGVFVVSRGNPDRSEIVTWIRSLRSLVDEWTIRS